jgi:hypothetical protein
MMWSGDVSPAGLGRKTPAAQGRPTTADDVDRGCVPGGIGEEDAGHAWPAYNGG